MKLKHWNRISAHQNNNNQQQLYADPLFEQAPAPN